MLILVDNLIYDFLPQGDKFHEHTYLVDQIMIHEDFVSTLATILKSKSLGCLSLNCQLLTFFQMIKKIFLFEIEFYVKNVKKGMLQILVWLVIFDYPRSSWECDSHNLT